MICETLFLRKLYIRSKRLQFPWRRFLFGKKTRPTETNEQKIVRQRPDMYKFWTMITYEEIFRQPQVAMSLIGMSLQEFDKLYAEFELTHSAQERALQLTRRYKAKRRRAVGAGRKHKYPLRDRLLMTLFWLRAYTTYEVLGFIYGLDKTTVEDNLNHVFDTLAKMKTFHFELPQAEVPKLRSVQEVIDAFPPIRLLIQTRK